MRIAGGRLRGRTLTVPPGIRPTAAGVREALFSIWNERIPGARFLDLFAGSGAVGLEALSRGAASVTLVEKRGRALAALRSNCRKLGVAGWSIEVVTLPARLAGRLPAPAYDLVFCDPPYGFLRYPSLLAEAAAVLAPGGELACEHDARRRLAVPPELELVDERVYGDAAVSFLRSPGAGR